MTSAVALSTHAHKYPASYSSVFLYSHAELTKRVGHVTRFPAALKIWRTDATTAKYIAGISSSARKERRDQLNKGKQSGTSQSAEDVEDVDVCGDDSQRASPEPSTSSQSSSSKTTRKRKYLFGDENEISEHSNIEDLALGGDEVPELMAEYEHYFRDIPDKEREREITDAKCHKIADERNTFLSTPQIYMKTPGKEHKPHVAFTTNNLFSKDDDCYVYHLRDAQKLAAPQMKADSK
ncbi:unnamed protein product [Caenorhabditis sp. 36 PRJEB53466]|nr:unnamed protein product [Caenorhabditis sp. 36 PRJEB53466]